MKKMLREPLLHFLIIGALLFWAYGTINPAPKENKISVDDNLIDELIAKWELQRNRQPTLEELLGLVDQFVNQEVLYQEALAMNLDHNDEIVKRRLAQKMEFISDNMSEALQPTEEMLRSYYDEYKDNYIKPAIYTMKQVYFSNDNRSNAIEDAKSALNVENPEALGDNISLASQYTNTDALKISRDFGYAFTTALVKLPTGEWTGPINSGLGIHIVYITERKSAGYFTFNEAAEKVNVDYNYEASNDFKKELIASLLKSYTINIEIENPNLKTALDERY